MFKNLLPGLNRLFFLAATVFPPVVFLFLPIGAFLGCLLAAGLLPDVLVLDILIAIAISIKISRMEWWG
jgi:hypothetical protein